MQPQHHHWKGLSPAGFHNLHYTQWGEDTNKRIIICVHGLSRNSRDFDFLAKRLQNDYRIICPDMPGRGESDWLKDPSYYSTPQYLADLTALIARLNADSIDWIGTSMGGILGLILAAQSKTPIKRLIINDVGAFIPAAPLKRIIQYVSQPPIFDSYDKASHYLRQILNPFGIADDHHWEHLARHSIVSTNVNQFRLHHDPQITSQFPGEDINLWAYWQAITCPTLIIRGQDSDLLPAAIAEKMIEKEKTSLVTIEGVGHAPALMSPEQITIVEEWLQKNGAIA